MKIEWDRKKSDPYTAVGNYIGEHFGWGWSYIARIMTTTLGVSNEYCTPFDPFVDDFEWENDWYEGGDVYLLGVIRVDEVEVPPLKETEVNANG